jgi:hypothetical protein
MSVPNRLKQIFRGWNKRRPRARDSVRLQLEVLENRLAPAVDMVTNLSGSTVVGSLSYEVAIAKAGDTIGFQQGLQGTITPNGNSGIALAITKNLTIQGPGANVLTVSGGRTNQVIVVDSGVTASISGLTISEGHIEGNVTGTSTTEGGGIFNLGNLTLTGVEVTNNSVTNEDADAFGGGIFNAGNLTLTASTVDHNIVAVGTVSGTVSVVGEGGGIYNASGGTMTMINDTVADNTIGVDNGALYGFGAGVSNSPSTQGQAAGVLTLINVTVAGNQITGNVPPTPRRIGTAAASTTAVP